MITEIPACWEYSKDLETLFFFYQRSEEMLSKYTVDTYYVKMHNTISLCQEALALYNELDNLNIIDEYYTKYICDILDELIFSIHNDEVVKQMLGVRLESVITGLNCAKKDSFLMERWVELIIDLCPIRKYFERNKEIIFNSINSNRDKDKLLIAMTRFYSCLINFGYSEEYLYKQVKEFFQYGNNEYEKITIKSANVIRDFVNQFDFKEKDYEFVLLIDNKTLDYFKGLNLTEFSTDIEYFDEGKIAILTRYKYGKDLVDKYHEKCKNNENIKIVRYKSRGIDYLSVINRFEYYMDFVRSFESYFKHYTYYVNVYSSILKITKSNNQEDYISIADRDALQKRPYISQDKIDKRIKTILKFNRLHFNMWQKLIYAIQMHHEAVKIYNKSAMLRDFWIALESLFSNPKSSNTKNNAISSTLSIIQKTYILKRLRTIYHMLNETITDFVKEKIGISTFNDFVIYFSKYDKDSPEMKQIYSELDNNPLLRYRLYELKKTFKDGKSILKLIDEHEKIVTWQIKRIYRIRNISTHLGYEFNNIEGALYNLHNYFDYVVNYIICCCENGNESSSIGQIVFEIQNDNQLFREILKDIGDLNEENYVDCLFGGDSNLINYEFEFED
jgi:hypothetical protein